MGIAAPQTRRCGSQVSGKLGTWIGSRRPACQWLQVLANITRSRSQTGKALSQGIKHAAVESHRMEDNEADGRLKCRRERFPIMTPQHSLGEFRHERNNHFTSHLPSACSFAHGMGCCPRPGSARCHPGSVKCRGPNPGHGTAWRAADRSARAASGPPHRPHRST